MSISIQQAIDTIIAEIPGAPFGETVDIVKAGDTAQNLRGVGLTFLATNRVIEQAIELGINLLITHEPTFYNHLDSTDWLKSQRTYQVKRAMIEKNGLVIWRFHDYLHSLSPDPTIQGLVKQLGWEEFVPEGGSFVCKIPPARLADLVEWIHQRTSAAVMRVVGDPELLCEEVALLPGFPPAEMQMEALAQPNVDVLITGEVHEWETSEYARDAGAAGLQKGLVVMGHQASEEPGIRLMVPWIQARLAGTPVHFIPTGSPFWIK